MSPSKAYITGLKLLATRELSEAQLRLRLARRGHEADDIESAIARLKTDRSLDDERTAAAIARTEAHLRHRGMLRVRRKVEAAGIAPGLARRVTEDVFQEIDADALMARAIDKRLRGRTAITDDRELQRLYRYLVGQGFEPDRVVTALRSRR
jgi:regulatory protein